MDFSFKNDFAILPVKMRLIDDLKTGVKQIQRDLAYLKTSPIPFGYYYITNVVLMLPWILASYLALDLSNKLTMGFSNVPGPKQHWYMIGKRCKMLGFNMPLGKTVPLGWGVISHGDNLKVTVTTDRASVKDLD
jgi:hypothetical protein